MGFASFLKCWIYTSVGLVIIVGILIEIIFLILAFGHFAEATESKTLLIVIGTVSFCILLIVGLLGIYGAKNQSFILLILYTVILGLVFVGLWVAFAYMKKGKSNIHNDYEAICKNEKHDTFINELKEVYDANPGSILCTGICLCKADKAKFPASYAGANMNKDSGARVISECDKNPVSKEKKTVLSFLGWIEEELECSGMCSHERYYYFSDVNRGPPPKSCKGPILDYVDSIV